MNREDARKNAPVLLFGIGNPSRGDDAIGPDAIDRLQVLGLNGIALLTDFQLQVEHTLDLAGRREVVFIDAAVSGTEPFSLEPVIPAKGSSVMTHALSPPELLAAYERINRAPLPDTYALAVRGYRFDLGAAISNGAAANLDAALQMLVARYARSPGQVISGGMSK